MGHDYDKKRRERVVSRILLLMARPGQTTGPLFRPVGEAVEMECMRAFREEWGSCVENMRIYIVPSILATAMPAFISSLTLCVALLLFPIGRP